MAWLTLALPEAAATLVVLCGLGAAMALAPAPRWLRWPVLGVAMLLLVLVLTLRGIEAGQLLPAADMAGSFGLTLLAITMGLRRRPHGLTRMARAAGAGWASVLLHAVLRPVAGRLMACWGIGLVSAGIDSGLVGRLGIPGSVAPGVVLVACAALGLALLVG